MGESHKKAHLKGAIYMTERAWDALRIEAARRRVPMGELVMELIQLVQESEDGRGHLILGGEFVRNDREKKP